MPPEIPDVILGEPVESAWGNDIRDRTVQRYVDATERDALNPFPKTGDLAWLSGSNELQAYTDTEWLNLARANYGLAVDLNLAAGDWENYGGGFCFARYIRYDSGLIVLQGLIRNGTTKVIADNLPAPWDTNIHMFHAGNGQGPEVVRVDVKGNGSLEFEPSGPSGPWFSLDGISYYSGPDRR